MTKEEIIDMQIEFYRKEFERTILTLQGRKDNLSNLTEEATRYAHYIDALEGVKFIISGKGEPGTCVVDVIDEKVRQEKIIAVYDKDIKQMANTMSHGDTFLAEELRSEIYITILSDYKSDLLFEDKLIYAFAKAKEYLSKKEGVKNGKIS
jgi:hypothetical protein